MTGKKWHCYRGLRVKHFWAIRYSCKKKFDNPFGISCISAQTYDKMCSDFHWSLKIRLTQSVYRSCDDYLDYLEFFGGGERVLWALAAHCHENLTLIKVCVCFETNKWRAEVISIFRVGNGAISQLLLPKQRRVKLLLKPRVVFTGCI